MRRLALAALLLAGCTHWVPTQPVTEEQLRADLGACVRETTWPVVGGPGAVGFTVTFFEELAQAQLLDQCMAARGYRNGGLTWRRP